MRGKDLRIVYMGTPEFAVEPLRRLYSNGYNIVSVVTMPDKPAGRGQKLKPSPVKEFAVENNIPLLQPEKMRDQEFLEQLKALEPDLAIVVAFKILPEIVWSMPKFGTFNLHTSILPQYRGAAPINWAIINGDKFSGVTTFMLDKDIDTGAIIGSSRTDISEQDTAETLHDRLMDIGSELVLESVEKIAKGDIKPIAQTEMETESLRPAPKIFKEDCEIDWNGDIDTVYNKIRGLSPYPASWAMIKEHSFKIFRTEKEYCDHNNLTSEVLSDGKTFVKVACRGGYINILELQMAGKKRMEIKDFLRGCRLFDK